MQTILLCVKLFRTGHAMWPAIIVDESVIVKRKGLNNKISGGRSVLVQFFGTHDFARWADSVEILLYYRIVEINVTNHNFEVELTIFPLVI